MSDPHQIREVTHKVRSTFNLTWSQSKPKNQPSVFLGKQECIVVLTTKISAVVETESITYNYTK
jgi:hypothetical protein